MTIGCRVRVCPSEVIDSATHQSGLVCVKREFDGLEATVVGSAYKGKRKGRKAH